MDEKTTVVAMEPQRVTVIGGTGDGGTKEQVIVTPAGQPNIIKTAVPTALALLVRFLDTLLTVVVGVLGVGGVTDIIAYTDFKDLLLKGLVTGAVAGGVGLIKDLATIVGKLKDKFPLLDV